MCGAAYFSLGTQISFTLFPAAIATTAVLWLVFGDLSAALIGVSFGGDAVVVKLGREGKKSLEGSLAMFLVCFITGMIVFQEVPLCEYGVFFGSLAATLTELYEPFGLNDNLTIPIFSALALHWGLLRVESIYANRFFDYDAHIFSFFGDIPYKLQQFAECRTGS